LITVWQTPNLTCHGLPFLSIWPSTPTVIFLSCASHRTSHGRDPNTPTRPNNAVAKRPYSGAVTIWPQLSPHTFLSENKSSDARNARASATKGRLRLILCSLLVRETPVSCQGFHRRGLAPLSWPSLCFWFIFWDPALARIFWTPSV
jgi:hypothetical protein